jgi:hypothetical protein
MSTTKTCNRCGIEKILSAEYFHVEKRNKDGFRGCCKECFNTWYRNYWKNNIVEINEKRKKRYKNNPTSQIIKSKEYRNKNKEAISERNKINRIKNAGKISNQRRIRYADNSEYYTSRMREYRSKNPIIMQTIYLKSYQKRRIVPANRINDSMRSRMRIALKGNKRNHRWIDLIGYTLNDLVKHLENKFQDGMSWDNYGKNGWTIDHIIPVSVFNFRTPNDIDFKRCWSLDNLQPMWQKENFSKHNKLDKPFQPSLAMGI